MLDRLRDATGPEHRAIEDHPLLEAFHGTGPDHATYARVLAAFHAFYRKLEPSLTRLLADWHMSSPCYRYRRRLPLLSHDLLDLGIQWAFVHRTGFGTVAITDLTSRDHVLGALYVLEGSTQGGRIIASRLLGSLGLGPERGARYFNLYREGTWPAYMNLVTRWSEPLLAEAMVTGARRMFADLLSHLDAGLEASGPEGVV